MIITLQSQKELLTEYSNNYFILLGARENKIYKGCTETNSEKK